MRQLSFTMMAALIAIMSLNAESDGDRAVATFVADMARMSSEQVSFTSMKCDKEMLSKFNIETNDPGVQGMLNSIGRLYMIHSKDNTTVQLMRKRVRDMESRGVLNNYTEIKQDGNNVTIYLPSVMQMSYILATINMVERDVILVIADEGFYELVERLRTE